jgi:hypothetical protein
MTTKTSVAERTLLRLRERILRLQRIKAVLESGETHINLPYYRKHFTLDGIVVELDNIKALLAHVASVL